MMTTRKEMATLRRQPKTAPRPEQSQAAFTYPWVDKKELQRYFDNLFATLSIQGSPIGVPLLQEQMRAAGLEENELSRGIIEAWEECEACSHEVPAYCLLAMG
jgi:hypothetical protein